MIDQLSTTDKKNHGEKNENNRNKKRNRIDGESILDGRTTPYIKIRG